MPKASRESASKVIDTGATETRYEDLGDYIVGFGTCREYVDYAPLLKDLPDGLCQTPHWGYIISGRLTYHFPDHDEVYEAGDAFYAPAKHTVECEAGVVGLYFSPKEKSVETMFPAAESAETGGAVCEAMR